MRSTRATAAVSRLNQRSAGRHYLMVMTGSGLFLLRERIDGSDRSDPSALVREPIKLPLLRRELLGHVTDRPVIGLLREMCSERTTSVVRTAGEDALAAVAEDTGPPRAEPGEVTAEALLRVARVGELDPDARHVQG